MERKKRRLVGKFGGDRKSDQDLESGLVFLMSKEREAISVSHQHANGTNPKHWFIHCLHNIPTHASNQAAIKPALFDCVPAHFLTRLTVWAKKGVRHGEETNRGKECATCRCSSPA